MFDFKYKIMQAVIEASEIGVFIILLGLFSSLGLILFGSLIYAALLYSGLLM